MRASGRRLLALIALPTLLLAAPSAEAAFKAKTSLSVKGGSGRIVVKLASTKRLTARTKPRSVTAKADGRTYKLKRVRGAAAAAVKAGTWRSGASARLLALGGKRITVTVRSRAGRSSFRTKVAAPGGGGGQPGGGATEDAKAVAFSLINGQEFYRVFATQHTSGEELWRMCAGGRFLYRYTSSGQVSTSESYGSGSWSVTSAKQGTVEGTEVFEAVVALNGVFDNQPRQGNAIFDVSRQTTRSAINAGDGLREYIRRAPTGGC